MWQRFSERARKVIFFSQEEAGRLGQNCVSTEHLLLGLLRENDTVAARIIERLGFDLIRIRGEVDRRAPCGEERPGQEMCLVPDAKQVIDFAYEEAQRIDNRYIGTEHILLGLIRDSEGVAGRVLAELGVELESARAIVMTLQATDSTVEPKPTSTTDPAATNWADAPPSRVGDFIYQVVAAVTHDTLGLKGTSLLSIADLSREQLMGILGVTTALEAAHKRGVPAYHWKYPRALAMIFEKPSLRTRVSFDLAMQQLGGLTVVLGPAEIGLGTRESVPDIAHNLERMVDAIMARVFKHEVLVELRDNCKVPVINALSDREHPCQTLADLYTLQQKRGKLEGLKLAYIGDGNNVLHSLLLGGALTGMTIAAACPKGYEPLPEIVEQARALARDDSRIVITNDAAEAAVGADAVYTDVWTSMGQEKEQLARIQAFRSYQVNAELMARAKPDAIFMHCLPAHRGDEVTNEVVDGPQSVVFDQAENRLHAQKAVLALTIGL